MTKGKGIEDELAPTREELYCLVSSWGMDYHHFVDDPNALDTSRVGKGVLEESIGLWTPIQPAKPQEAPGT